MNFVLRSGYLYRQTIPPASTFKISQTITVNIKIQSNYMWHSYFFQNKMKLLVGGHGQYHVNYEKYYVNQNTTMRYNFPVII